ncbi:sugar transferase [bacterium]|nr:sugar transferase [bacterium]
MLKEKDEVIRRVLIFLDGVVIAVSFLFAFFLRRHFHLVYTFDVFPSVELASRPPVAMANYLIVLFVVVPLWCAMLYTSGMYHSMRTKSYLEVAWVIIKSAVLLIVAFSTVAFLFKIKYVSRLFFAIFVICGSFFLYLEKLILFSMMHYAREQGYNFRRILIVGTGKRARDFIDRIKKHREWGIRILGIIDDEPGREHKDIDKSDIAGSLKDVGEILNKWTVDEVIFVIPRSRLNYIEKAILACETKGIKATVAVDLFELKIARARQTEFDGVPLITFDTTVAKEWELFVKRAVDIVVSAICIIIFSPLFLFCAVLIKATSKGPVFFLQKRVGLNGRKFILYKFRTMYQGSHKNIDSVTDKNIMTGPVFKIKKDPRVTSVGRLLRKFSVDELPQLFNVFTGRMSLVGPRPPIPKEVAKYEPWQMRRLSMRPGLTCLWQISGRNEIGFDEWMKLDLKYLDNWSLWLDFMILMRTIPVVIFGKGAY